MPLTAEQVAACNARLDAAGGRLLDLEGLLRESGRFDGSVDGLLLAALLEILGVVGDLVNAT